MYQIDVPDETLRDWDRIQAEIELSRAGEDDESEPGDPRFAPMTADVEELFNFGHRMSLEYLP